MFNLIEEVAQRVKKAQLEMAKLNFEYCSSLGAKI